MAIKGSKFNKYSDEFKLMVVEEYLTGTIGYERLAKKYNMASTWPIRQWVKKYQESKGNNAFEDQRKLFSGPRKKDKSLRPPQSH